MNCADLLSWLVEWRCELERENPGGAVEIKIDAVQNESHGQCVNWRLNVKLHDVSQTFVTKSMERPYSNQMKWIFFKSTSKEFIGSSGPEALEDLLLVCRSSISPTA